MTVLRAPRSAGKVRPARLTDLAALGELSRLCQSDSAETRSLGLPVNGPPIGVFSLFRLPLGAFRPNDLMYVYDEQGHIAFADAPLEFPMNQVVMLRILARFRPAAVGVDGSLRV